MGGKDTGQPGVAQIFGIKTVLSNFCLCQCVLYYDPDCGVDINLLRLGVSRHKLDTV